MVLVAKDVGEHGIALIFEDQTHGDARSGSLDGDARIHQGERRAAHRRHRGRAVRFRDLRYNAQRVRKFVVRRQDRMDGPPGELAVADLAAARSGHPPGLAYREWPEGVMSPE